MHNEYLKELERQLILVCRDTVGAVFDCHMFMFPKAFWHKNQNTRMYYYTWYAIRLRTIIAIKKIIEPSGKNKINIHSIVKLLTKPDNLIITDKEKEALLKDYEALTTSDNAKRVKRFRDSLCHNTPDEEEAVCYYKDFMYILDGAMYILESLYRIVYYKEPAFFYEIRDIGLYLSDKYWLSLSKAAGKSKDNEKVNTHLYQLLDGKF